MIPRRSLNPDTGFEHAMQNKCTDFLFMRTCRAVTAEHAETPQPPYIFHVVREFPFKPYSMSGTLPYRSVTGNPSICYRVVEVRDNDHMLIDLFTCGMFGCSTSGCRLCFLMLPRISLIVGLRSRLFN